MPELVYPPVIAAARTLFRALDLRFDVRGAEHVPRRGGAVLASNHIGYLDFVFAGFAARPARRLVRFMAKESVFRNRVSGPLMRGMRHIPVDRARGEGAFRQAVKALRAGEVVGVFPEATISPSFTLAPFKSGAARMAQQAGVPLLPVALWGSQRLWTKDRPRDLRRRHVPITIRVGAPLAADPAEPAESLTGRLRGRVQELLEAAQRAYPGRPQGSEDAWWLPAHLGGTAPPPEPAR
ncbi:lysophospholipid acyltransferase family protein [Streptomyces sp. B6B3]|uniref:lysophospholipid acyltransferase family protein n=1 Tax=Streptomyces sp. B6B3 TaxID=3153570 RepID=UPI00325DCD85